MAQGDWIALALGLGFAMGWFVAWLQESQYQKGLDLALRMEKRKVAALEWKLRWVQEKVRVMQSNLALEKDSRSAQERSLNRLQKESE